jgi:hypothetical protein
MRHSVALLTLIGMALCAGVHAQQYESAFTFEATTRMSVDGGVGYDAQGNRYIAGVYWGEITIDGNGGQTQLSSPHPDIEMVVAKYDLHDNLIWHNRIPALDPNYIGIEGMTVDSNGDVYVVGGYQGTVNFEPGTTDWEFTSGGTDSFIMKLNSDGDMQWTKVLTGSLNVAINLAIADNGDLLITGTQGGLVDFDPPNGVWGSSTGIMSGYLLVLDQNADYRWHHTYDGGIGAAVYGVAGDSQGNVYVSGLTNGDLYFSTETGNPSLQITGNVDSFAIKYDNDGNRQWIRHWGEDDVLGQIAWSIHVDHNDDILVAGEFRGTVDFDNGANTVALTAGGNNDPFVLKLNSDGDLLWARAFYGTYNSNSALHVNSDETGVYVVGRFANTIDLDPGAGTASHTSQQGGCGFLVKLDHDGDYDWSLNWGSHYVHTSGIPVSTANGMALGPAGHICLAGFFRGTAVFDPSAGGTSYDATSVEGFVFQVTQPSMHTPTMQVSVEGQSFSHGDSAAGTDRDFGAHNNTAGATSPISIELANPAGTSALDISNLQLTGADSADFVLDTNGLTGTIPIGGSATVTVAFDPQAGGATGTKVAALTFNHNDLHQPDPFEIPLTGEATEPPAAPEIAVRRDSASGPVLAHGATIDFGTVTDGNGAQPVVIVVQNFGNQALTVNNLSLSSTHFALDSASMPSSIAPGADGQFTLEFTPHASQTLNAVLTFEHNDTQEVSPFTLNLTGVNSTAAAPPGASGGTQAAGGGGCHASSTTTSLLAVIVLAVAAVALRRRKEATPCNLDRDSDWR